jgi:hypothetical protein
MRKKSKNIPQLRNDAKNAKSASAEGRSDTERQSAQDDHRNESSGRQKSFEANQTEPTHLTEQEEIALRKYDARKEAQTAPRLKILREGKHVKYRNGFSTRGNRLAVAVECVRNG